MTVEFSFLLLSFFRDRGGKFIQSSAFIWGHICYFPIVREQPVSFHDFLQPQFSWILFLYPHPACSSLIICPRPALLLHLLPTDSWSLCLAKHSSSFFNHTSVFTSWLSPTRVTHSSALALHCGVSIHPARPGVGHLCHPAFQFHLSLYFMSFFPSSLSSSCVPSLLLCFLFCGAQTGRYPGKTDSCFSLRDPSLSSWKPQLQKKSGLSLAKL